MIELYTSKEEDQEIADKLFFDKYIDHSWVDNAWMGLGNINNIKLNNPILHRTKEDIENPGLHLLKVMRNPDYLGFTCKTLLGWDLLPIQLVVLEEMWKRRFPMIIINRGGAKTTMLALYATLRCVLYNNIKVVGVGAAFRQSKLIFEKMEEIWNSSDILRSICDNKSAPRRETDRCTMRINDSQAVFIPIGCLSGDTLLTTDIGVRTLLELNNNTYKKVLSDKKYNNIGFFFDNGIKPVKKITTKCGYSYIGTNNHKMKIVRNNEIIWCRTDEMKVDDFIIIDKSQDKWFEPIFNCTEDEAYVLGAMIGDGSYVNKHRLQFTNIDKEIIDVVDSILGGHFKNKDGVHFYYNGKDKVKRWLDFWELEKTYTPNKKLPNTILSSSKKNIASCLSALYDTDGGIQVTEAKGGIACSISFFNTSKILVDQIRYLLLKFGIISSLDLRKPRFDKRTKNYSLPSYVIRISGKYVKIFYKEIGFRLKRKQELLEYYIDEEKGRGSINSDFMPISKEFLYKICEKHSLGQHFTPSNIKIRKNIVREYLFGFINRCKEKKVEQELIDQLEIFIDDNLYFDPIKKIEDLEPIHTYDINVPENNTYNANGFISHNTGEKIRGLRANIILTDEMACLASTTLIQTNEGLIRIKDYLDGNDYSLVNIDNNFERPDTLFITPKIDVYKITTANGYSFKCSAIHQVLTSTGWKIAKDLSKDDFLEMSNNDYFPEKYVYVDGKKIDENAAWLFGLLVSEGTLTNQNYIDITTTDIEMKNDILARFPDFKVYEFEPYTDNRGWKCKRKYAIKYHNNKYRKWLYNCGLDFSTCYTKKIPWTILKSPRSVIVAFLQGLFWGDGSCFKFEHRGKKHIGVSYYSTSEQLIEEIQVLLLKFNITSTKFLRKKTKLTKNPNWMLNMRAVNAIYMYELLKLSKWERIIDGDYLKRKPFIKKNGNRYICQTNRNNKNVHVGTFDTEEECLAAFDKYWKEARPSFRVKSIEILPEKEVLYDFHLPQTHTFLGNGFIQHNSVPPDIYETVVTGFAAVTGNPFQSVKEASRRKAMKDIGIWSEDLERQFVDKGGNQAIITGTAYYSFNHFYDYWRKYSAIVKSKGDKKVLSQLFGGGVPENFNWRDYSVIRIPFELMPENFMDEQIVARSKATVHSSIFLMEFGSVFATDSDGFFKRSLIESCVVSDTKPIQLSKSGHVLFEASLRGDPNKKYVFGVDPASEHDNFSIIVLELNEDHTRIVHCWTTNRQNFKKRLSLGATTEHDFYKYTARKIRDLMMVFPCERIAMDSQGGGVAVAEALQDPGNLKHGEKPIYPTIDPEKEKETDHKPGLHILELCNFAKYEWVRDANHGLRKDLEDKCLLFPRFDSISLGLAADRDADIRDGIKKSGKGTTMDFIDSYEDCIMEIEELKNEMATITVTVVGTGVSARERWDVPEVKMPGGKKGRMRKDRYSSLLMANMIARTMIRAELPIQYTVIGGFAKDLAYSKKKNSGQLYIGPDWFVNGGGNGGWGRNFGLVKRGENG